jgi:hypothetical protein
MASSSSKTTADEFIAKCAALKNVNGVQIPVLKFEEWTLHQLADDCTKVINQYGMFRVIEKIFDDNRSKPNLVAMAGYSDKSFCGSSQIIFENLDLLKDKYRAVYIICYDEEKFKGFAERAAIIRDAQKAKDKSTNPALSAPIESLEYKEFVWGEKHGEIDMYNELSAIVDKVIRCLGITKVHLLGKSAGGGTAMNIVSTNPIYERLYLAVPAHPTFCKSLEKLGNRLNTMKVIIGWNKNDDRDLGGIPSNKHIGLFEPMLADMKRRYPGFQYEQHMFEPGNFHEINPELLRLAANDRASDASDTSDSLDLKITFNN